MSYIIDGYNLIHAAGILGRGSGSGGLQRARRALLNSLAESLDPRDRSRTTVVFDAGPGAPRHRPRVLVHHGMTVRFASNYDDADTLIEELIQAESAPRSLTVVSSDHRLQRAAHRRKAKAVDSDRWYATLLRDRQGHAERPAADAEKPAGPRSAAETRRWLEAFTSEETGRLENELEGPFPPGFGEDLGS